MTKWLPFATFIVIALFSICPGARTSRVETLNGAMEGLSDDIHGVTVDSFLGVPFAEPPVGNLRFR